MASRLKKKRKRERPDTMDYQEALKDPAWENEVSWADAIMTSNRRLGLGTFKLDKVTKGEGSCFPISVVQQLNREDVYDNMREDLRPLARTMDHHMLRVKMKDFICRMNWNHWKVIELKEFFYIDQAAKAEAGEATKTWEEYWESMLNDTEWADGYFIQATAWYLEMEIQIMDTKCNEDDPYYTINGDFTGEGCSAILFIGYYSEVHYQSLLIDYDNGNADVSQEGFEPIEEPMEDEDSDFQQNYVKIDDRGKRIKLDEECTEMPRAYNDGNKPLKKEELDNRCPKCFKTFKKLLLHIKKSQKCKVSDADLRKLDEKSRMKRNENVKENMKKYLSRLRNEDHDELKKKQMDRMSKSRENMRKDDPDKAKKKENEWKSESREKMRQDDPDKAKKKENEWKSESRKKMRQDDPCKAKKKENEWKSESRERIRKDDPDQAKKKENEWKSESRSKLKDEDYKGENIKNRNLTAASRQKLKERDPEAYREQTKKDNKSKKLRQDSSFADRLRKFQEAVIYGPMFICCSCHGKMFRCAVKVLSTRIVMQIDEKIPIEDCIDLDVVTMVVTESRHCNWPPLFKKNDLDVGERFICETCLR